MNRSTSFSRYILVASVLILGSCSGGIKDRDGNSYTGIKIGNQVWMAENLNVTHFRNGDAIPEATTPTEWELAGKEGKPAWCNADNNQENGKKYGKLYNWFAVNDPRGLAPEGWHVSTDDDWTRMTNFLGGEVSAAYIIRKPGVTDADTKAAPAGFSGLPGGACNSEGSFYGLGSHGLWWTSTEFTATESWMRVLNYVACDINSLNYTKPFGLSVRCVKD